MRTRTPLEPGSAMGSVMMMRMDRVIDDECNALPPGKAGG